MTEVNSTSDASVINNTMRHQYRILSDDEKAIITKIKDMGLAAYEGLDSLGTSRELSISKEKVEEAVMWAVKHVTK